MAITATLANNQATEQRIRNTIIVKGKMTLSGTYVTGGFSVAGIHPKLAWLEAQGGAHVWHYNPETRILKAMKAVDTDGMTPDGKLTEAANGATLTDVIYYRGYVDFE